MIEFFMSRKNYRSTGLSLIAAGAVFILIGILLVGGTALRRSSVAQTAKKTEEMCVKNIQALELDAVLAQNEITVTKKDITNGTLALSQASLAINTCPGWVLSRFCMGEACNPPGLQFTLQRQTKK